MARKRFERTFVKHSYSRFCTYSFVGRLSTVGLGHKGQRTGAYLFKTFWISFRVKRSYSSDPTKSRGQHHLSYCHIYSIPPATTRDGSICGTNESSGRAATQFTWTHE